MLSVQLSFSIWMMMLYGLIPLAVLLLAVSSVLPQKGSLHNAYERVVRGILFYPLAGPTVTFIKAILLGLSCVLLLVGGQVYNDTTRPPLPASTPLDKQLLSQAKGFRNQRNLYLTALALVLWWALFSVFAMKAQIARLLESQDAQGAARMVGADPALVARASASSATPSGAATQPLAVKNITAEEGIKQRRNLPKPSAPPMETAAINNALHTE